MADLTQTNSYRLAEMWCHGEINVDEYFAEIDRRAPIVINQMIREERAARLRRA